MFWRSCTYLPNSVYIDVFDLGYLKKQGLEIPILQSQYVLVFFEKLRKSLTGSFIWKNLFVTPSIGANKLLPAVDHLPGVLEVCIKEWCQAKIAAATTTSHIFTILNKNDRFHSKS